MADSYNPQEKPILMTEPIFSSRLMAAVEAGGTTIVGPLHKRDEVASRQLHQCGLNVQLHLGIGNWIGSYHWIPDSDLFDGLPVGGLAGAAYVDVLLWYGLLEQGGEVLAVDK